MISRMAAALVVPRNSVFLSLMDLISKVAGAG